ncbi:MAG: metallophosphoesterase [Candidatus Woesearchaeota archaeon]
MPTKLATGVYAVDVCTYLPDAKTLIVADLHLGYEESLGRQGVLVPKTMFKRIIKRLDWILEHVAVEHVVLNGDVKHEFGTISTQEWREVRRFVEYLQKKGIAITVVKGNHDTILGPMARVLQLKEVKEARHRDILIVHGDYVPQKLAPIILMGHEHPAIILREKAKSEKFKCFLKGKYKKCTLIVQPSMNPLTEGTDVLKEQVLSPLIKDILSFEAFIIDDKTHEVLPFGKIRKFSSQ